MSLSLWWDWVNRQYQLNRQFAYILYLFCYGSSGDELILSLLLSFLLASLSPSLSRFFLAETVLLRIIRLMLIGGGPLPSVGGDGDPSLLGFAVLIGVCFGSGDVPDGLVAVMNSGTIVPRTGAFVARFGGGVILL